MQEPLPLAVSFVPVAASALALLVAVAYLSHKSSSLHLQNSDTQVQSRKEVSQDDVARASTIDSKTTSSTVYKESDFPENWWTDKDIFDLEKRAIFSKTWLYVSHRSHFTKPGDYHSFELAAFPVFLILGKDGVVRAFHNVCRHRAYTITRKESGSSTVLGCRYHGWSYNTRGDLVKAPHFENVPSFDKSQNGLFEIHTRTTEHGLIFINLDANPTVPEVDSACSDAFASREGLTLKSTWVAGWTFEGAFNWKVAVDSRNSFDLHALQDCIPRSILASISSLVTDTQYNILLHLKTHLKLEKTTGTEVFPALRRSTTSSKYAQADTLCRELDCLSKESFTMDTGAGSGVKEVLVW
ncbi:hypothetical protein VTN00DRAFT_8809 [Thermoascus crustaceus]|uniref:uncharacterized protein n=1 Tax=Thermoascus crustaceus TaxID=5088 RepID=UPI00374346F3